MTAAPLKKEGREGGRGERDGLEEVSRHGAMAGCGGAAERVAIDQLCGSGKDVHKQRYTHRPQQDSVRAHLTRVRKAFGQSGG